MRRSARLVSAQIRMIRSSCSDLSILLPTHYAASTHNQTPFTVAKTPISDEELQLRKRARRRLVGAIVLVLLVVVLVPMFLEREPRLQKQDMDIRIPPVPGQTQAPSISGGAQQPAAP